MYCDDRNSTPATHFRCPFTTGGYPSVHHAVSLHRVFSADLRGITLSSQFASHKNDGEQSMPCRSPCWHFYKRIFKRKQSMKKGKRRVRRLALDLRSIRIQPTQEALNLNTTNWSNKKSASRLMNWTATAHRVRLYCESDYGVHQPCCSRGGGSGKLCSSPLAHDPEKSSFFAIQPPVSAYLPRPSCRMGCGFPKRSWLTR